MCILFLCKTVGLRVLGMLKIFKQVVWSYDLKGLGIKLQDEI